MSSRLGKEFKKHWRYAQRLKEGGTAWDREMSILENLKKQYQEEQRERFKNCYSYFKN